MRYAVLVAMSLASSVFCGVAPAVEKGSLPKPVITGAEPTIAGEILVLDASTSEGATSFRWMVQPPAPTRRQLVELDEGRRAIIATWEGSFLVTLIAANDHGIAITQKTIVIDKSPLPPAPNPGPNPSPNPGPGPNPKPKPIVPEGEFGIAPRLAEAVAMIKSQNKSADATKLAEMCGSLAAQIAAGTAKPNDAVREIAANLKGLGTDWDAVRLKVHDVLKGFYDAGKLNSNGAWSQFLREAEIGLRAGAAQ